MSDNTAAPLAQALAAGAPVPAPVGGAAASEPALCVEHLSFTHAGAAEPVLRDASLTLEAGSFALLVGGTGSGKSTLLSLIKPEIAPAGTRAGHIRVFGELVGDRPHAHAAQTVGFVFQDPNSQLVCDTVWHEMAFGLENLGMPQDAMRCRVAETSYFFGMDDWFHASVPELSGGRKQLLALASVIAMRPRLLLLDEPTAQLDPIATRTLLHALFRVNRELGCTVLVATHEPQAMVDYATCAFSLEEGVIKPVSNLDELRVRPALAVEGARFGEAPAPGDGGAPSSVQDDAPGAVASRPAPARSSAPADPAAEIRNAWFRYGRDDDWVLRGLDLRIERGSIHALVGGNGSGKSTLLGLMAGTRAAQRGTLKVRDRAKVLLPQDPCALFAAESVCGELSEWSGLGGYGEREVAAMLARLGLERCSGMHPFDLSGGQRQLLALGKLLLARPRLLLLDEPTKGLDLPSRRLIARICREEQARGATIVLASHDLDFVAQVATEVSMVFDGAIACTQPTAEFFANNLFYRV